MAKKKIKPQPEISLSLTGKREGVKHLIDCKCILPQYKNVHPPIFHKFIVFSEIIEPNADVVPSYVSCNNCGVIHRIIEINQSVILKKEESAAVPTIDDIKINLPEKLVGVLDKHDLSLATWQEVQFILEQKYWGRGIVLSKEKESDKTFGKYLMILGENLYKIDNFEREEGLI